MLKVKIIKENEASRLKHSANISSMSNSKVYNNITLNGIPLPRKILKISISEAKNHLIIWILTFPIETRTSV